MLHKALIVSSRCSIVFTLHAAASYCLLAAVPLLLWQGLAVGFVLLRVESLVEEGKL